MLHTHPLTLNGEGDSQFRLTHSHMDGDKPHVHDVSPDGKQAGPAKFVDERTPVGRPLSERVIRDGDAGVSYQAWEGPEGVVGWRCTHDDGRVEFVMLNPSGGSDDGVATVFVYVGDTGDVALDAAVSHVVVFPEAAVAEAG